MQERQNRHLCRAERDVIYRMNQEGKRQHEIARFIGVTQGTISKELSRNAGKRGYRAAQADHLAVKRQKDKKARRKVIVGEVEAEVRRRLFRKQTPELICGAMKRAGDFGPSHESIYQYIARDKKAGGSLWMCLPVSSRRRYGKRNRVARGGAPIPNRTGIEHRPAAANNRTRYGDWEVDLIAGSKGSGFLLSLYERRSRYAKLIKLESKKAGPTASAIIKALRGYKVRTITYDNGLEFARHETVSLELGAEGYFCQPYHSWEKGGVEHFNRLVRMFYPKGTSFADISTARLKAVETKLNQRPKKLLGFRSPSEYQNKIVA